MTKKQLVSKLKDIKEVHGKDPEGAHSHADNALLEYINDADVYEAFDDIEKWYA